MISSAFIEKYKNHLTDITINDLTKNDSFCDMKEESIFELLTFELTIRGIIQRFDNKAKPLLIMKLTNELQSIGDRTLDYEDVLNDKLDSLLYAINNHNKKGA